MTAVSEEGTTRALPIDKKMLSDMQKLVKALEDDLRVRSDEVPEASAQLRAEYDEAVRAERTRATYESWRDEVITQIAVAWVLACVFVRFMEDNDLVAEARLAGTGRRRQEVIDAHEAFFRENPRLTEREYLQSIFEDVARLPGCSDLFGKEHNPLWHLGLSGDGAKRLLEFWQQRDSSGEGLLRTFERPAGDTRFLGDLYQDLSEAARKRYALLQTPDFVEEFILDYTLNPAIETFGLEGLRMIDPTCGSGHFLLGGFKRLCERWRREEPGLNERELARRALGSVFGVDLNPFAVAIARFRLLVATLWFCGIQRMKDAPDFHVNVAAGDSLLHGRNRARGEQMLFEGRTWLPDTVARGDYEAATRILSTRYHAVVGNPPYITDKDEAHRETVRQRYDSCHGKFSLGVPFTERFFDLAQDAGEGGFVGLITTNSFMKREFGKKLIEAFLPQIDLTHVLDTSGAYIPGHGTPTVIMFGRARRTVDDTVRAVLGIRGEPSTPDDPTQGKVWRSIVDLLGTPRAQNEFVSVADVARETFGKHPWSMGGGGARELKDLLEQRASHKLSDTILLVGVLGMTNADEVMLADERAFLRRAVDATQIRPLINGDAIRDWLAVADIYVAYPYDSDDSLIDLSGAPGLGRWLWPCRAVLGNRATFNHGTYFSDGLSWWKWHQIALDRLHTPLTITFAEISTHNHFVLDRGGNVFKQTAPIIKLPPDKTEGDHLTLIGALNSSVANFWMRQVCYPKGGDKVGTEGARRSKSAWEDRVARSGGSIEPFPVRRSHRLLELARQLDLLARLSADNLPPHSIPTKRWLCDIQATQLDSYRKMISQQEELDWHCYGLYGLLTDTSAEMSDEEPAPPIELGQRAFEIVMARKLAAGELETTWFARHGSAPVTALPASWPDSYKQVVLRRIALMESNDWIRQIEQPEYKRRWQREPWEETVNRRLRTWLLERLESPRYWPTEPELTTTARLAGLAIRDRELMQVAELYRGRADFDVSALVAELVKAELVPALPALRYTESGLRKRAQWEATWSLQRREDAGETIDKIPVPPKYTSADFQKTDYWRLRGKLDVPKERFISFPHCERDTDNSLPILWAGYDHLQQAKAIAAYYLQCKESEGWPPDRLTILILLATLNELTPWLLQWHNDVDLDTGERLGDFYQGFFDSECRALNLTPADLTNWKALQSNSTSGRKKT